MLTGLRQQRYEHAGSACCISKELNRSTRSVTNSLFNTTIFDGISRSSNSRASWSQNQFYIYTRIKQRADSTWKCGSEILCFATRKIGSPGSLGKCLRKAILSNDPWLRQSRFLYTFTVSLWFWINVGQPRQQGLVRWMIKLKCHSCIVENSL